MSGRGRSNGAGRGKGGPKRRQNPKTRIIDGITQPALRRLARRGGVKRINGLVYEEMRDILKTFLCNLLNDSITYCEYSKRKTVTTMDIIYSLKRQNHALYGYD
uniref:Histone H4 n=1 Tax=Panagrolaimus davidi TaxID=227884 RepID=A0A914PZM7_9BILA